MAFFEELRQFEPWDLDYVEGLAEAHGLSLGGDLRARMFVHAANMLNAIVEECEIGPVFRVRDITTDPDALEAFITTLTAGAVALNRDWLRRAVQQPRANRHNQDGLRELGPWEIDVLSRLVLREAWDAYEELGYQRPCFIDPA
jgi:hypothetical protein